MKMEVRTCGPDDLETLRVIGIETFTETFGAMNTAANLAAYLQSAFDPARLRAEMDNPGSTFYLLMVEGQPAGYMKLNVGEAQNDLKAPDLLEVERIYVRAPFQGRGLGRVLMQQAFQTASQQHKRAVWLGVWERNTAALGFYEKQGFRITGTHAFMLGDDHQTDYVMTHELTEA